jgi:branched-chain amino acid transport system permease protein
VSVSTLGQAVLAGLANGAFYALLALGFAIVFGLTRALNLAHGEWVVLGGYVGYTVGRALGLPLVLLAPLAALALVPIGLLWRALIARLREPVELTSLVATFALALGLQSAMLGLFAADYRLIAGALPTPWLLGLARSRAGAAGVALVTILGLHVLLTRTRVGLAVRATSRDPEAAQLMGIDTDRVGLASFAAAAAIAGASGVFFAASHYLHPAAGLELTLLAVTLAILGDARRGGLTGLVLGGLALGLTESLVILWAGPRWRELVVAGLLFAVLWTRGSALEGRRGDG